MIGLRNKALNADECRGKRMHILRRKWLDTERGGLSRACVDKKVGSLASVALRIERICEN